MARSTKFLVSVLLLLPFLVGFGTAAGVKMTGMNVMDGTLPFGDPPGGGGLTVLHQMDFNGSGCTDDDASYTCTVSGINANCTGSPCPIEGTESASATDTTHEALYAGLTPVVSGELTLDFRFNLSSTHTVWRDVFGMTADASTNPDYQCFMEFEDAQVRARSHNGSGSTAIAISESTDYYGRLVYDVTNDDCSLFVSTSNFGASDVGSELDDGTLAGSVVGWAIESQLMVSPTNVFDDIVLCSGSTGSVGRCDQ